MKHFYQKKGFTLVETLLYVSILAMLVFILSVVLISILQSKQKSRTVLETEGDGQRAMQIILQTVRNSTSITSPTSGASGSTLTLAVPDGGKSPTIFSLSAGKIMMQEGAGSPVALTSSQNIASGLNFSNTSSPAGFGSVKVQFNLAHSNPPARNEFSWSQNFLGSASIR